MESIGEALPTGQNRTASDKWGQYRDESLPFNRSAASHSNLHRPIKYSDCVKIPPTAESPSRRLAKPTQPLSLDSAVGYQPAPRFRENLKKHGYGGVHVPRKEPKKSSVFWLGVARNQPLRGGRGALRGGVWMAANENGRRRKTPAVRIYSCRVWVVVGSEPSEQSQSLCSRVLPNSGF